MGSNLTGHEKRVKILVVLVLFALLSVQALGEASSDFGDVLYMRPSERAVESKEVKIVYGIRLLDDLPHNESLVFIVFWSDMRGIVLDMQTTKLNSNASGTIEVTVQKQFHAAGPQIINYAITTYGQLQEVLKLKQDEYSEKQFLHDNLELVPGRGISRTVECANPQKSETNLLTLLANGFGYLSSQMTESCFLMLMRFLLATAARM